MNPFDIVFFGCHRILEKTIYGLRFEKGIIGPKEHSFFVTFLLHGVNVSTLLNLLLAKSFSVKCHLYLDLFFAVLVFAVGYLVYFRMRRANEITMRNVSTAKATLYVILFLAYVIVSVYFMLEVDSYVRYQPVN